MPEVLTLSEIQSRFQSEWILIEEPQTNATLQVLGGTVRWHSADREELYRKLTELHPKRFAILYTGTMPTDTAIVL